MENKPQVEACLEKSFDKSLWKIVSEEYRDGKRWLKLRKEYTLEPDVIPADYIPFTYRPIEKCPPSLLLIPPPPVFSEGDCVSYTYWKKGKLKIQRGRIKSITNDEAAIEVPNKLMGVYGITFQDIYTLNRRPDEECEEAFKEEAVPKTAIEYDGRYTLVELREMAKKKGLSPSGSKKEIARRLIKAG